MRHLILISLCSLLWTACGNTDNDFDASGTFEATEILVSSEANGKIMELNIEEGEYTINASEWLTLPVILRYPTIRYTVFTV
jgi:hypothetical protein